MLSSPRRFARQSEQGDVLDVIDAGRYYAAGLSLLHAAGLVWVHAHVLRPKHTDSFILRVRFLLDCTCITGRAVVSGPLVFVPHPSVIPSVT